MPFAIIVLESKDEVAKNLHLVYIEVLNDVPLVINSVVYLGVANWSIQVQRKVRMEFDKHTSTTQSKDEN